MILHLRYRSVCRYAHSGRSFFLLPLSADLLPARSVPVFYGIQYNCCRLSLFTSSEKPGQPADTSTLYHITFQHTTNNSTRICAVFYCLFTKYMFLSSPVMCAYQSPNRERKSKRFTIFPPDAMLFENDPENQSANRKDMYYVNRKNNYFGSNRRNRRIQGGEPLPAF